jgi:hypothetical protein
MSTLFEVPCPECARPMSVDAQGDLRCSTCEQSYHARMGLLFPVGEPPDAPVIPESPPGGGPAGRPTAAAQ